MKQVRIVRIELTTKDWKSPILPLNYIRKFCSGITLPLLRLERKSLYLTMTNMNNNTFNVCQTEYGEQDSNLHEVSLTTSLVLRDYQFHHLRIW